MQDNPSSPRIQTALEAVLVDSDGGELSVEVIELSSGGGFRLRTTESLVAGEQVSLRVARYRDFQARIQWVEGCEAGGKFLEPVSLENGGDQIMEQDNRGDDDRRQNDRRKDDAAMPAGDVDRREDDRRQNERRKQE